MATAVWRQQPGPLIAAIIAIAMGVALGLGIDLVNRSALSEFDNALTRINGQAQYRLTGASGQLSDEWLGRLEQLEGIQAASPVIETDTAVLLGDSPDRNAPSTQSTLPLNLPTLKVIGLDIFRAAQVAPAMLPQTRAGSQGGASTRLFADDAIFLSAAAQRLLANAGHRGTQLNLLVNGQAVTLKISGTVPGAAGNTPIAIMDIGAAQMQLQWLGRLSRIDLRLQDGIKPAEILTNLAASGAGLRLARPDEEATGMSNLSRAYRVNLSVLALVALLTGGFIVYAAMELAVIRMIPMLALVGVLGAPVGLRTRVVIGLAIILGAIGALAGIALGIGLAWGLLGLVGGDLGGGYFSASRPQLVIAPGAVLLFAGLGVATALLGALSPAIKLRHLAPAQALKSGQATMPGAHGPAGKIAAILVVIGIVLLFLPAIANLPIGAYLAIACWLFAGVMLVAPLLGIMASQLSKLSGPGRHPLAWLAIARLNSAHQAAFPALAGVVASFALVCAMGVMVHSFRISVDQWLEAVLPADIYLRVSTVGATAGLSAQDQATLSAIPGVRKATFMRAVELKLNDEQPAVALLARGINIDDPGKSLPLTGDWLPANKRNPACIAIYPSEPAATIYQWHIGALVELPIGASVAKAKGSKAEAPQCYQVTAIWRDYARQLGAIAIAWPDYKTLTGDNTVNNAAFTLDNSVEADTVIAAARLALPDHVGLQLRSSADIRRFSLTIFDRSFAVTYALEAVALLVGLFGVATTYSGEALARAREFGMLRHLGLTRRSIASLFALESCLAISAGVIWGAALGAVIAQVLIHRVNPQSFHWTMQTHWPGSLLLSGALALLALGVIAAIVSARRAAGAGPVAAVRADW